MASSSLAFPSLQPTRTVSSRSRSSQKSSKNSAFRRLPARPSISASITERPILSANTPPSPAEASPPSSTASTTTTTTKLPIRNVPGDYGLPLVGAFSDRLDYFYNQGRDDFFKSRIQKHGSTVFRTNMPPGPFIAGDPRVVVLLDGRSFPVLFDTSKVEKRDLFTGTFMPSTDFTGGYRVLSYLDPSEPNHPKLKRLMFHLLQSRRDRIIPEFRTAFSELFDSLDADLAARGKAAFAEANDQAAFNFLARALYGRNPADTKLGTDGPGLVGKWVLFQLSPLLTLGLPKVLEDLLLHTVPLPPALVKKDYNRLYAFFRDNSGDLLEEADKLGISREEACHNLLFATCFNSFGGMKIFFPSILKWIGRAGAKLHARLAEEIRAAVRGSGGRVTMAAMERDMPLTKSAVYEAFRIEPPVPLQYGRAKRDLLVESHDAAYKVREGELLFGYQPFATKDPRIFDRAEEYVADRFVGEEGERLLKHVLWSNGPETESPAVGNKQCAGKDFVNLVSRLFLIELFLRYDSFDIEVGASPLGASVNLTSLKRASF